MPTHSPLYEYITLVKGARKARDGYFLRAESFYNVASEVDRLELNTSQAYGGKSLHAQSHGESFFSLISSRFFGEGLYLLDEPESALSPVRQMALLVSMNDLVKAHSQFIIATHSPILLAYPGAQIFVLNENGIKQTEYKDTDHYLLTKMFLDNPEKMMQRLLNEDVI